ncbi:hypothetical protein OUY22_25900 [Nonomuraea sp. MCN248]|uniref:HPt domain-containing protein n=1 Tax=Nonomuraea corallina TaxID=2989783 RepID=A0ABT4SI13_9ACTN|nr:hypothetical protein [Nonomuraea corallina]MDA0636857.1 hypothetical protein [Nonomuraea corallina]
MTRSEFDDIRAFLADPGSQTGDLLAVARALVDDLEQARMREAVLRTHYLRLLTAARASVAAEYAGSHDPMTFVKHELGGRGQLPERGEAVQRILSDARTAAALLACLAERETKPRPRGSVRLRRCVGPGRSLPR